MSATLGREELRAEIAQALCCHGACIRGEEACWKYTTSGHKKITDAILAIFDRLAAKPADEGDNGLLDKYRQNLIEECAKCVPTNWCDVLLTGPDAPKGSLTNRDVERLLRGIQDRIRALSTTGQPKP